MLKASAFILCLLTLSTASGQPNSIAPAAPSSAGRNTDKAAWADWEAQARMTDGDYDGAVVAEQQANAERREADLQELLARSSKR